MNFLLLIHLKLSNFAIIALNQVNKLVDLRKDVSLEIIDFFSKPVNDICRDMHNLFYKSHGFGVSDQKLMILIV